MNKQYALVATFGRQHLPLVVDEGMDLDITEDTEILLAGKSAKMEEIPEGAEIVVLEIGGRVPHEGGPDR